MDRHRSGGFSASKAPPSTAQEAFQQAKRLLAAAVQLQHPAPNAELSLATDASDTHIRGVMQQKSGHHWRHLSFFSRKLTDTDTLTANYWQLRQQ
jgi:ferric iron reductase protein FhuF